LHADGVLTGGDNIIGAARQHRDVQTGKACRVDEDLDTAAVAVVLARALQVVSSCGFRATRVNSIRVPSAGHVCPADGLAGRQHVLQVAVGGGLADSAVAGQGSQPVPSMSQRNTSTAWVQQTAG